MTESETDFPAEHLDLARGLAALTVAVWHWRNFFFRPYDGARPHGLFEPVFYFATGFSREAVMIFFVLSGYFIARSVRRDLALDRWSWRRYAVARGTRLYLVLVPALFLGAAWDFAGLALFGLPSLYDGQIATWGPVVVSWPVASTLTLSTFVGTLAFLQTVWVPLFGSNGALWSLAYEGWYYVMFPLGLFALRRQTDWRVRLVCVGLMALVVPLVGRKIAFMFSIWLAGAAIATLPLPARKASPLWLGAAGLVFAGALVGSRFHIDVRLGEWAVALSFAGLLYAIVACCRSHAGTSYARFSAGLSGCSYTLYLVHMPLLLFLAVAVTGSVRWAPDAVHLGLALMPLLLVCAYAWGIAQLTETHTSVVRAWVYRQLTRSGANGRLDT